MIHPSGGQSIGSRSHITHGGRESFDGSVGGASAPSLSHSVRFNENEEDKKGIFVGNFLSLSPHIHARIHTSTHHIHHSHFAILDDGR